jgi:nicotinamide riboside kinase
MIRIAVTGAHSVGKSTLVQGLSQSLCAQGFRAVSLDEPIGLLREELAALDLRDAYLRLLEEHFRRLDVPDAEYAIYDRTLLDMLAYFRGGDHRLPVLERALAELLRWHVRHLDLVIYLPIEFPIVPRADRPPSEALRSRLDASVRHAAAEAGINLVELRGDPATRLAAALALVQALTKRQPD